MDAAFASAEATHTISGTLRPGGQEHFYLEPQTCFVVPHVCACWANISNTQVCALWLLAEYQFHMYLGNNAFTPRTGTNTLYRHVSAVACSHRSSAQ